MTISWAAAPWFRNDRRSRCDQVSVSGKLSAYLPCGPFGALSPPMQRTACGWQAMPMFEHTGASFLLSRQQVTQSSVQWSHSGRSGRRGRSCGGCCGGVRLSSDAAALSDAAKAIVAASMIHPRCRPRAWGDPVSLSRARCSVQRCFADPGPSNTRSLEWPRISSAPLTRCAASGAHRHRDMWRARKFKPVPPLTRRSVRVMS